MQVMVPGRVESMHRWRAAEHASERRVAGVEKPPFLYGGSEVGCDDYDLNGLGLAHRSASLSRKLLEYGLVTVR